MDILEFSAIAILQKNDWVNPEAHSGILQNICHSKNFVKFSEIMKQESFFEIRCGTGALTQ